MPSIRGKVPEPEYRNYWHMHCQRIGRSSKVRNEAVLACKRLGRLIWKVWSGYHHRSLGRPRCIASIDWASV